MVLQQGLEKLPATKSTASLIYTIQPFASYLITHFKLTKWRIMNCAGHVARMGRGEMCAVFVGNPKGKMPFGW